MVARLNGNEHTNVHIPQSPIFETLFSEEKKVETHLMVMDPSMAIGEINIKLESENKQSKKESMPLSISQKTSSEFSNAGE